MHSNVLVDLLTIPTVHFDQPTDVITATALSHEQKLQVLVRWEADARKLMVAADENMGSGEPARLDEVHDAFRLLGVEPHTISSSPTIHGHQPTN